VNPRERSRGIEPLVKKPLLPGWQRDHLKIAADVVNNQFGPRLDAAEKQELAGSVARQWQRYEGHACLFVGAEQFVFTLAELGEGNCNVSVGHTPTTLQPLLCSLGLAPEAIPEAVARINLDQEIEFQDHRGVRCRIWHDPRTRQLNVRPIEPAPAAVPRSAPPLFCPRCNAVLRLWQPGERQQVCPCCGSTVTLGE